MSEIIRNLPIEKVQELRRAVYRNSLYDFAHFLGYADVNSATHCEIIKALESPNQRKVVCVPRGSFKSTLCSISYPLWLLVKNPNLRILVDSELYSNAVMYLRVIKQHMKSDDFMRLFGNWEGPVWRDDSIVVAQRTKKYKEPSITVGSPGTIRTGMHYDVIIADDMNSQNNSKTPEGAQKIIDHYRYNLNILEPDGLYAIIGTRYSEDDLIGWVLREILDMPKLSEGHIDMGEIHGRTKEKSG